MAPDRRTEAEALLRSLSPAEREALLVSGWMSHDARWFTAAARKCGFETANRLNQAAAHEVGKVEARRIARAVGLPPVTSRESFLLAQEIVIRLMGPDLLEYDVAPVDADGWDVRVRRCFAHDNVVRAGVLDRYECGIFARVTGWLEGFGLAYEMTPGLGGCMKAGGRECVYRIRLRAGGDGVDRQES